MTTYLNYLFFGIFVTMTTLPAEFGLALLFLVSAVIMFYGVADTRSSAAKRSSYTPKRLRKASWLKSWLKNPSFMRLTTLLLTFSAHIDAFSTPRRIYPRNKLRKRSPPCLRRRPRDLPPRQRPNWNAPTPTATVVANILRADTAKPHSTERSIPKAKFDSDSVPVTLDTGASYTMTNDDNDFVPGTVRDVKVNIKGLGNTVARQIGTVRWRFLDDKGVAHSFLITDVLHVPDLDQRLLSPQHLTQCLGNSAHCDTTAQHTKLFWCNDLYTMTIRHGSSNIAQARTAPSNRNFTAYKAEHGLEGDITNQIYCFPAMDSPEGEEQPSPPTLTGTRLLPE